MAAGDTMQGVRIPVAADGRPANMPAEPGEYVGPVIGFTADLPAVFFLKPNARDEGVPPQARSVQHVCSPPHTFVEEDDGTLTISPSLSDFRSGEPERTGLGSDGWHGFLEHGVWREV